MGSILLRSKHYENSQDNFFLCFHHFLEELRIFNLFFFRDLPAFTTLDGGLDPTAATHWTEMNIEETMAVLTRCSFDEQHRQPIFNLGGIPALAELIQVKILS